ncbi:S-adenosyl-L-methionine-dependent methyltransferase [Hypoxylon argillaceum]|nr:S-adenosyl-L-methionine-dependent methyltransferase [Hypoxylon argillaceum]
MSQTNDQPQEKKLDWSQLPEEVFRFMESRTASNSAAFLIPLLKESAAASEPGSFKMLDVGAGAGSMTSEFAQIRWGVSDNVSFEKADGYKLPYDDGTFDVVHCHQVLVHNKNPWDILTEMLRVTKTGGVCAAREGDLETEIMWPPLPGMLKFHHDFEVKLIVGRGGCATAGRELLSWALKTGVKRHQIKASFSTWSYTEPEERKLWASGMVGVALGSNLREKNVASGISTEAMDEMRSAWQEWVERDDAVLAQLIGEVIIRKE